MGSALGAADWLALALRAASLAATLLTAGTALFLALVGRELDRTRYAIVTLGRRTALAAIVLVAAQHGAEAGRLAGSLSGIFDATLQRLLLASPVAGASGARIFGLVVLLGAFHTSARARVVIAAAGTALIGASYGWVGHTVSHPQRWLLAPALVTHVAVAAFWFGGLAPLLEVIRHETHATAGRVVARFSLLATWLVPLILVAGLGLATALSPRFALLASPFDRLLSVKVAAFGLLMTLAAANKWRFAPRVASGDRSSARLLRLTIRLEWAIIGLVLVATTMLTALYSPHD